PTDARTAPTDRGQPVGRRAAPARARARPDGAAALAPPRRAVRRPRPAVHRHRLRRARGAQPIGYRTADRRAERGDDPERRPPGLRARPRPECLRRRPGAVARHGTDSPPLPRRDGVMFESFLEFLVQGVILGGLYALFAVGLTLIFGVLDVINVAHGEFFAVGGYLVFVAVVLLGLHPFVGIAAASVGAFVLGLAVYPLLLGPLRRRLGRRPYGALYLVLTLGLSTFMQNGLLALAG